ncbi:dephospho-CoA kinase [Roseateles depolymerans]|uniref:Dephospho-CoA kinase n=1 Tax=Roseateles depolymerans TaxID=76731 RepID=A0A0U3MUB8_9BURK|nr:dephospho-CoA kinase [Roseateles depolymerans]ALV05492.1 dephospho-CoA kinase [Roseateles depolymerans]REG14489.1 dephospho-CoA kinase [Roseateles depolymerans]
MRIGLTGGIGSGKSTVAQALVSLGGCRLVDTDAISRALTQPGGAAMPIIAQRFGAGFVTADGALDRPAMRALAFQDPSARQALEAILHPLIGEETERQALLADPGQRVVFDVPLLVESGRWRQKLHRVLVVDCEESTQVQRVMQRSGLDAAQVRAIMAQQASRAQRRSAADAVVYNDGLSLDQLHQEVAALLTSPLF